ncbi:MAG: DUF4331 family protein [Deltaproteobacteria bacterium]|nr:DUF4331 family protein [Deltaproteobacteria bacterium]
MNDVYTWMNNDATKLNLVMTVSPGDPGTRTFGPSVQYVFHVTSKMGGPSMTVAQAGGTKTNVTCTFASNTSAQCWVHADATIKAYVKGDPSAPAGMTSTDGKIKVFAGRRSDPFFFNLQGFRDVIQLFKDAITAGQLTRNPFGCINGGAAAVDATFATARNKLMTLSATPAAPCNATDIDCFKTLNVMAVVVQVDKTLVNATGNTIVGVWGSTHAAP